MQHGGWIVWQSELTQKVEIIIKVFAGTLAGIHNFHFIVYCEDAENWQMIASPGFYHEHWTKEKIEIHCLCCKDWKKLTLAKTIFVLTFIQFREVLANFYISRLRGQPTKRQAITVLCSFQSLLWECDTYRLQICEHVRKEWGSNIKQCRLRWI